MICQYICQGRFFSGLTKDSTVPAGNFAKAAFVGAKTVKSQSVWSTFTRLAALIAATSVV